MTDQTNQVEIDQAELERELDQIHVPDSSTPGVVDGPSGASLEGAPPAAAGQVSASWAPVSPAIVQLVDLFVCPAWKLTQQERDALAEALAPALDQLFPGGLGDERWAPYARLAMIAGGIVLSRFDRETGKLAPLRDSARQAAAGPEAEPPVAPSDAAAPGGAFTIGTG